MRNIAPIRPARIGQNALENPGRLVMIAGWGNTIKQPANGSNYPDRMRKARVPIVSDARARDAYGPRYVGALMVAAGREGRLRRRFRWTHVRVARRQTLPGRDNQLRHGLRGARLPGSLHGGERVRGEKVYRQRGRPLVAPLRETMEGICQGLRYLRVRR